jgi:SAM-dependent methyltransferase
MAEDMPGTAEADMRRHSRSFDQAVDLYERGRPAYPDAAVRWMVPAGARDVLDLAAGTGKLTRVALAAGYTLTAVEPLDGMRAELTRQLPAVRVLGGTAEQIPVPDASADAILVGQAWHWFDEARAVPEITRVLRPGGGLGLVWNDMDSSVPWVARVRELIKLEAFARYANPAGRHTENRLTWAPALGPDFGNPEWESFSHVHRMDLPTLLDSLASRSYLITMTPADRAALLGEVADMLRTHPETAELEWYDLPYRASCMRAAKRG